VTMLFPLSMERGDVATSPWKHQRIVHHPSFTSVRLRISCGQERASGVWLSLKQQGRRRLRGQ
jgi:hypothetical protein